MQGKIFNFQRYSIHDGPGIRSVLFISGCPLRCLWCCNPECFFLDKSPNRQAEVGEIMGWIIEDEPYFRNSGGGVTLSGGEPLSQIEFTKSLLEECRRRNIGTAIETCGEAPWADFESISGLVDYYLYDLKQIDAQAHKRFTGVGNRRILDNLKRLGQRREKIILRIPLIPDHNLNMEMAAGAARLAAEISALEIDLLPYHRLGSQKYSQLNFSYPLDGKRDLISYPEGRKAVEDFARALGPYSSRAYIGG